jgi:RimJ/RimL family protein N-acetyltransferase
MSGDQNEYKPIGLMGHLGQSEASQVGWYSTTAMITLLALDQIAWTRVADNPGAFAAEHTLTLGAEPDLLRTVGQQTVALLQRTGATTPWTGYLAVDREQGIIIGTCAFTAPPDVEGVIEIAYFTFPAFEGRGYATAMGAGLVELAEGATGIRKVRAHTLPERNASTRILEKLGFDRTGAAVDPEVGQVWRWERNCHLPSTCH